MGLNKVKKGLEKELEARRKELLGEAEEAEKRYMDEAKEEIKAYKSKRKAEYEEKVSNLEKSELASAKLLAKKKLLNAKKEAIDKVFDDAMNKLVSMSPKKREKVLKELVKSAEEEIDVDKVFCASKDTKLVKNSVASDDVEGGVICESKDGKSRVDLTFSTLLSEVREKHLKEVAEKLF